MSISENNNSLSNEFKRNILGNMLPDNISRIAIHDSIIMQFGEMLFNQNPDPHLANYVRQRIRQTARLLERCQILSASIKSMEDVLDPTNFDIVVAGVQQVSEWDENSHSYGTAGLPLKLGHNLKRCAELKITNAIINEDSVKKEKASGVIQLIDNNWKYLITRQALRTLSDKKYNQPDHLPLAEDVKLFNQFLNSEMDKEISNLKEGLISSYRPLAETTLTSLILFNRKRSGEAQRITIDNFTKGMISTSICPEAKECLSALERNILTLLKIIEIKGKKGRKVPILLRNVHIESIKLLLQYREDAGVLPANEYVFARNNFHLGHQLTVVRKFVCWQIKQIFKDQS